MVGDGSRCSFRKGEFRLGAATELELQVVRDRESTLLEVRVLAVDEARELASLYATEEDELVGLEAYRIAVHLDSVQGLIAGRGAPLPSILGVVVVDLELDRLAPSAAIHLAGPVPDRSVTRRQWR